MAFDRRVNHGAYYIKNAPSYRGDSIHSYGKIDPIGDCTIIMVDRKGNRLANTKFPICSAADRLLFGKVENKIYTTNENGEILFSNVSEQRISITLMNNFCQHHRLRLGTEKVYITFPRKKVHKKATT